MFSLILVVVVALCVCALKRRKREMPPLLTGAWPIFGHTFVVLRNTEDLYYLLLKFSRDCIRQGGAATARILTEDVYFLTEPAEVIQVLNSCLVKDIIYEYFKPWLGEGLISASVPIWKKHRKLLNPTFNQVVLDGYLPEINYQARTLVRNMEAKVGIGKFDHAPYLEHTTLRMICSTAMGVIIDEKDKELREKYIKSKSKYSEGLIKRAQTIWLHSELIYSFSKLKKNQEERAMILHEVTNEIIDKRRAEMNKKEIYNETRLKPFLELLLQMEEDGIFTAKEVQEEVDTFTFAGSDTTSVTLTIVLLVIGSYPEVQRKIVEEFQEIYQETDRDVEKQDLLQLKYLEAVVKESLRLYPTIPFIARTLDRDVKIRNFTLRSGSRCFMTLYGVGQHSSWGEDAGHFRPERWLQPGAPVQNFPAFGFGKRRCIGSTFALMSVKTILIHLLRRYKVFGDVTELRQRIEVVGRPISRDYISIERRTKTDYIGQN